MLSPDVITSYIRTGVTVAIGALISWLVTLGVGVDDSVKNGLTIALTAFVTAIFYGVQRLVEVRWPALGKILFLGASKQPSYGADAMPSSSDAQDESGSSSATE